MVYIRIKKIKNIDYVYLVESKWNKEKHTSQQIIKQYLGPVAQMNINKIPEEYRNESTIIKFLSSHNLDLSKSTKYNESLQEKLLEMLKSNEINNLIKFYNEYTKLNYLLIDFYEKILIPVLYKIGDQWEYGEIDVSTEHVCSNAVNNLIDLINQKNTKKSKSYGDTKSIVLCIPEGELHSIGCKIIESLLLEKEYKVYNITSPLPTNSINTYLTNIKFGLLLISVTLEENLDSVIRFLKEIRNSCNIPIIIGGKAIKLASKSQIQFLEKYDKVYFDFEKLDNLITNIKILIDNYD